MFRNRSGGRGQGRGAGMGNGQGRGQGLGRGAGSGQGRGIDQGQGRGVGQQPSNFGEGIRQNQSLSQLSAGISAAEKKSWLERFKAHLINRMSEVDEELKKY